MSANGRDGARSRTLPSTLLRSGRGSDRLTTAPPSRLTRVIAPWKGPGDPCLRASLRPVSDRRRGRLVPRERGGEVLARAHPELGEDLAQVPLDGSGAEEQLRADLGVRAAVTRQAG